MLLWMGKILHQLAWIKFHNAETSQVHPVQDFVHARHDIPASEAQIPKHEPQTTPIMISPSLGFLDVVGAVFGLSESAGREVRDGHSCVPFGLNRIRQDLWVSSSTMRGESEPTMMKVLCLEGSISYFRC